MGKTLALMQKCLRRTDTNGRLNAEKSPSRKLLYVSTCREMVNRALFIRKIKYTMLQNHKRGSGPLCGCHPCPLHSLYSSNNLIGYGVLINVDHSFCKAVNSDHKLYSQELNEGQEDEMDLKSGCCNQPLFINNIQSKFILVSQNSQGP